MDSKSNRFVKVKKQKRLQQFGLSVGLICLLWISFIALSGSLVFAQTSPQVINFGPTGQLTSVNKSVYATFDSDMNPATLNSSTFLVTVQQGVYQGAVSGSINYNSSNRTATYLPNLPFQQNTAYNITLTTNVVDNTGAHLAQNFTWSFTTGAETFYNPHDNYLANTNSCASCHLTHTAQAPNLLSQTDQTTLCLTCHDGTGSTNNASITFQANLGSNTYHPVQNTGNYVDYQGALLQCTDCHNPHLTNNLIPTVRNQVYGGPLNGVSGVGIDWSKVSAGSLPGSGAYTLEANSVYEADICFKCHSNFATSPVTPAIVSEFNPANSSVHPLYGPGSDPYTFPSAVNGNIITMEIPFNQNENANGQHTPLKCSDCHGSTTDALTFAADSSMPNLHSSSNEYMLKKPWNSNDLCLLCHKRNVYSSGGNGLGSRFNASVYTSVYQSVYGIYDSVFAPGYTGPLHPVHSSLNCINCHGGMVNALNHGTNATYSTVLGNNAAPASKDDNIKHFLVGSGITGWKDDQINNKATCYTSGCHGH